MNNPFPPFIKTLAYNTVDPKKKECYEKNHCPVMLKSDLMGCFFEIDIEEFLPDKYVIVQYINGINIWHLVSSEYNHYFDNILLNGHKISPLRKHIESVVLEAQLNPDHGTHIPSLSENFQRYIS